MGNFLGKIFRTEPVVASVAVSAIPAGEITAPKWAFVQTDDKDAKMALPCMAFLIQRQDQQAPRHRSHRSPAAGSPTTTGFALPNAKLILFDLGLREEHDNYTPAQQAHIVHRQPVTFGPNVSATLRRAGIRVEDVPLVIYSHVHWDHTGEPSDFPASTTFVVGDGSLGLLEQGNNPSAGTHACFDAKLLDGHPVVALPPVPPITNSGERHRHIKHEDASAGSESSPWTRWGPLPAVLDLFHDGSIYAVPSAGHLQGHINLLCRTGDKRWTYLAGDTYHHVGLLEGVDRIATWTDDQGRSLCVHTDKEAAEAMLATLRDLRAHVEGLGATLEIISSHDAKWFAGNQHRLFPAKL